MYRAIDPTSFKNEILVVDGKKRYFVEGRLTDRPPVNIDYNLDNLWELYRKIYYPNLPSRRKSAFASPSLEKAKESSTSSNVQVYKVIFPESYSMKIALLHGVWDPKFHPDVKRLKKTINFLVSSGELKMRDEEAAHLFSPLGVNDSCKIYDSLTPIMSILLPRNMWHDVTSVSISDLYTHLSKQGNEPCEMWFNQTQGYFLEEL